jgi:Holliday junction DNA helicase RuvA
MITFLEGLLEEKRPTRVVLNVAGVGYEVLLSLRTFDRLPASGERCRLLIHDYLREDQHTLYGFSSEEERTMFTLLLGISGIGPKIALSALSGLSVRDIRAAVAGNDVKRLSSVTGIGKKMAERIVVELRHRITAGEILEAVSGTPEAEPEDPRLRDTVLALIALGYKQVEAARMAQRALGGAVPGMSVEDLVRKALMGR